tara:strand:+ start:89 stop:763 length:675 start_codon:yes stop_codon:yes gene_type:complete
MNKKLIMPIALILLIALSFSVSAKDYYVDVKQGWNLLYGDVASYDPFGNAKAGVLTQDNVVAKYRYVNPVDVNVLEYSKENIDQEEREYYSLNDELEDQILESCGNYDCGEYFEDDASWVYFDKPGQIYMDFNEPSPIESGESLGIRLFKGWNTKTFTPSMFSTGNGEYATIDDFKGDCIVEDFTGYDGQREEWVNLMGEELYTEAILSGFAIKVKEDCEFKAK